MDNRFVVVGIGELLWDVFPDGKRLGGAPVNFAFYCGQLGAEAYPVSCIGAGPLGAEIRKVLAALNVDISYVAEDAEHPTGTVRVTLDADGRPSYEICEGAAWDVLAVSGPWKCDSALGAPKETNRRPDAKLDELAEKTAAVCFGSLAQRSVISRATIRRFLTKTPPAALRMFDVNLRQTFYSKEIIEKSIELSNVLKLSDEELPMLAAIFGLSGSVQDQLAALLDRFGLRLIAYTRGADGSLLVAPDETHEHPGCPVEVVDSVGAGDSFTATLCMGLLNGKSLSEINDRANRVAAFVCSQAGATPVLQQGILDEVIKDGKAKRPERTATERREMAK